MKRSEAIKNLLTSRTRTDLAGLYNPSMEVQVNVAQDNGERVDSEFKGRKFQSYTDGIETWKHFRIPRDAKTTPVDNDHDLNYDLSKHTEGIGMTGWDWQNHLSRWVAFDFDAIAGHSEKHTKKLSENNLRNIQDKVSALPWVTIRSSTSGKGLHLYVFLEPVSTENHTEHAAVARAIIGLMSSLTGVDLQASVDQCGGNMWVWHRKMIGTNGLSILKSGSILSDVPPNWKDHLNVLSNKSRRTLPSFIPQEGANEDLEKIFSELTSSKTKVPLDGEHQRLIKYLHEIGAQAWWDHDGHFLVTHTIHLKEAHEKLNLRGPFETLAKGTERGTDWNCFAFPLRRGGWAIRRYTLGVAESPTWDQDSSGFTRCYFNREPDLATAARSCGGIEDTTGGFFFREAEIAVKVAQQLGTTVELPGWVKNRATTLKEHKDGRLIVQIKHEDADPASDMGGWLPGKGHWKRIYNVQNNVQTEPEIGNYDDAVRHLITDNNDDAGWCIKTESEWRSEPLIHIRTFLKSMTLKLGEVESVLGSCISRPWKLVCLPFQPEEPGDRQWNRNSPQLAFVPTRSDVLSYPHWAAMLKHIGAGLNDPIRDNVWCKDNGILTGFDYLKCWIASLFQEPSEPLPFLFFYSKAQKTGKSSLHEAISILVTKGIARADNALTNTQGFNGELENAILCVVEEVDLGKNKVAYNRIKDWVTSRQLPIHRKTITPYSVPNTSHWVQTANDYKYCPVFPGDSRIIMLEVQPLEKEIPRKEWEQLLAKEAPDFLAAILALELPKSDSRLNLPVIETQVKRQAEKANQTYLELFVEECCFRVDGKRIKYSDFYARFIEWLDVDQIRNWSKKRVGTEISEIFPKGHDHVTNQLHIGNISFEAYNSEEPILPKLYVKNDKLIPEERKP